MSSLGMWNFTSTIIRRGGKVLVPLPGSPEEHWGKRGRYHVRGKLDGLGWRGPLTPLAEGWYLSLGAAFIRDCHLEVGQTIPVELEVEGPQLDDVPSDLRSLLDADQEAKAFFESLATFYRKGYLRWLEGAKKPEKRQPRLQEILALLRAGKKQRED